jgi:L-ribulose-5-phosphate 3-epimerase
MKSINDRIGFMQGRLSPLVNGFIQAFPWDNWQEEFALASSMGVGVIEWTLDQERLYENPLLTTAGQKKIDDLCKQYSITISSITGDCFMQAPFWKSSGAEREVLQNDFKAVVEACAVVGIILVVVPLVDNGHLENQEHEDILVEYLTSQKGFLASKKIKILFESDFDPENLTRFIARLDPGLFGINYDIGNSAALGFSPAKEIEAYGERIMNVHIKDRLFGGTTVPLGTGDADFETVFSFLADLHYKGNYILQTARATDNNHAEMLDRYYKMSKKWIECYGT